MALETQTLQITFVPYNIQQYFFGFDMTGRNKL